MYHNSGTQFVRSPVESWIADSRAALVGDLSDREGYDFEQLKSITKVLVRDNHFLLASSTNLLYRLPPDGNTLAHCRI